MPTGGITTLCIQNFCLFRWRVKSPSWVKIWITKLTILSLVSQYCLSFIIYHLPNNVAFGDQLGLQIASGISYIIYYMKGSLLSKCLNCLFLLHDEYYYYKGRGKKSISKWNFVFAIGQHQNLKILVPTPHNTLVIVWGRDKNF